MEIVLEGVLDHRGNNFSQQGTGQLKARIVVDLYEPGMEISVDHEVHPEYLEVVAFLLWVDEKGAGAD